MTTGGKCPKPLTYLPVPANSPKSFVNAYCTFTRKDARAFGSLWTHAVNAWIKYETEAGLTSPLLKLTANGRPVVISQWVKRGRRPTFEPTRSILKATAKEFPSWWNVACKGATGPIRSNCMGMAAALAGLFFWRLSLFRDGSSYVEEWETALESVLEQLVV